MATYNLGKFILNPRGTYSSSATYNKLDIALYNGSSYICKGDSTTNKVPTNTTYWQLLANAGQATMTEAQKQEIISTLLAQGVIIDPDYNTYTSEEKTKLAGLSNANNGTLRINQNGVSLGTFSANQSSNTTVNIPTPNDGTIKLYVDSEPNTPIGTFSMNQKEDMDITIPVGSGGGTANNGTLTVKQGSTTLGTFTANQSTNSTITVANNALTIQRNGTTLGTYSPASTATVNISVPTVVSDLSDSGDYTTKRGYTSDTENTTSDVLDGNCEIKKLKSNYVYYLSNVVDLVVKGYDYDVRKVNCFTEPTTYIIIDAVNDFTIDLTDVVYREIRDGVGLNLATGLTYLVTVTGYVWRVDQLR